MASQEFLIAGDESASLSSPAGPENSDPRGPQGLVDGNQVEFRCLYC